MRSRSPRAPGVVSSRSSHRVGSGNQPRSAALLSMARSPPSVLTVTPALPAAAVARSRQIGPLINAALIVAVRPANGLTSLAGGDTDFDRVPGLSDGPARRPGAGAVRAVTWR